MAEVLFTIPLTGWDGEPTELEIIPEDIVVEEGFGGYYGHVYIINPPGYIPVGTILPIYINNDFIGDMRFDGDTLRSLGQIEYQSNMEILLQSSLTLGTESESPIIDVVVWNIDEDRPDFYGQDQEEIYNNALAFFRTISFEASDESLSCLDGEGLYIKPTRTIPPKEYWGLSTDEKPATAENLSLYHEVDTGDTYYFSDGSWAKAGDGETEEVLFTAHLLDENRVYQFVPITTSMYMVQGDEAGFMVNGYLPDRDWPYALGFGYENFGPCASISSSPVLLPESSGSQSGMMLFYDETSSETAFVPRFENQPDPIENKDEFLTFLKGLDLKVEECIS